MRNSCTGNRPLFGAGSAFAASAEITGFFRDILDSGASLRVRVTGRSMVPFLRGGEVVTIRKVPHSRLRRGDLIFVDNPTGFPILHRLIRRKKAGKEEFVFQTRGDALQYFDLPVRCGEILGRVCEIERCCAESGIKRIKMDSWLQRKTNYCRALIGLFGVIYHYGLTELVERGFLCHRQARHRRGVPEQVEFGAGGVAAKE